jgi:pilus assembly protein Flp/PilA
LLWSAAPRSLRALKGARRAPSLLFTGLNRETAMKSLALKVQRFLAADDGPTAVEYAVMLALIIIVCLIAIRTIGTTANTSFETSANELAGS